MPFADPIKRREYDKSRYATRKKYWREYRRLHPQKYESHGSSLAYKAEEMSLKILNGSKRINRPTDLKWEGKLVDVKTSIKTRYKISKNKTGNTFYWKFYLKQLRTADLFLLILQNEKKMVERVLLIPDAKIKSKNLRIAERKLHQYDSYDITLF